MLFLIPGFLLSLLGGRDRGLGFGEKVQRGLTGIFVKMCAVVLGVSFVYRYSIILPLTLPIRLNIEVSG